MNFITIIPALYILNPYSEQPTPVVTNMGEMCENLAAMKIGISRNSHDVEDIQRREKTAWIFYESMGLGPDTYTILDIRKKICNLPLFASSLPPQIGPFLLAPVGEIGYSQLE
jgi:hypothetical protein